jgi:hypothetical protein
MGFSASPLATASLIGSVGGALTSSIGSYYGAATQKAMLSGQAGVADINARIAELGAQSALMQGQRQIGSLTLKAGQLKGRQRAALAANGVDLGVGSAAELQASADTMKEIDKTTLELNAILNAWGYRNQAINFQNEALVRRATARAISPFGSAMTSLLGSAGQVAGSWYALSKNVSGGVHGFHPLTAMEYGTNPFSQQTAMLASQW